MVGHLWVPVLNETVTEADPELERFALFHPRQKRVIEKSVESKLVTPHVAPEKSENV